MLKKILFIILIISNFRAIFASEIKKSFSLTYEKLNQKYYDYDLYEFKKISGEEQTFSASIDSVKLKNNKNLSTQIYYYKRIDRYQNYKNFDFSLDIEKIFSDNLTKEINSTISYIDDKSETGTGANMEWDFELKKIIENQIIKKEHSLKSEIEINLDNNDRDVYRLIYNFNSQKDLNEYKSISNEFNLELEDNKDNVPSDDSDVDTDDHIQISYQLNLSSYAENFSFFDNTLEFLYWLEKGEYDYLKITYDNSSLFYIGLKSHLDLENSIEYLNYKNDDEYYYDYFYIYLLQSFEYAINEKNTFRIENYIYGEYNAYNPGLSYIDDEINFELEISFNEKITQTIKTNYEKNWNKKDAKEDNYKEYELGYSITYEFNKKLDFELDINYENRKYDIFDELESYSTDYKLIDFGFDINYNITDNAKITLTINYESEDAKQLNEEDYRDKSIKLSSEINF